MPSLESMNSLLREQRRLSAQIEKETGKVFQNGAVVARFAQELAHVATQLDEYLKAGGPVPTDWHLALRPRCATCGKLLEDGRTGGSCRGCQ